MPVLPLISPSSPKQLGMVSPELTKQLGMVSPELTKQLGMVSPELTSPLRHERLHPLRGAAIGVAGQQFGGEPGPRVLVLGRQDLGPVHAGGLDSRART